MPLPALDGQKTSLTFRKRINGTAGSDQPSASIAVTSSQGIPNDDREVSCSARLRRSLRSGRIPPGAVPEKDHRRPVRPSPRNVDQTSHAVRREGRPIAAPRSRIRMILQLADGNEIKVRTNRSSVLVLDRHLHLRPVRAGGAPDNLSSGTAGSAADNRAPVNRLREDDPREAEGSLAVGGDSRTRCKDRGRRIVV